MDLQIAVRKFQLLLCLLCKISGYSFIIMGSGIDNLILALVIVGKMFIMGISVKGKQKHPHSRPSGLLQKLLHRRYQYPKILCDHPVFPKCLLYGLCQLPARSLIPFSVPSVFILCRNTVISGKSDKMIQSYDIKKPSGSIHPAPPPGKAFLFHSLPVINGISPFLSVIRKGIRRTACHYRRSSFLI